MPISFFNNIKLEPGKGPETFQVAGGIDRGPWTQDEDLCLTQFIGAHGEGCWSSVPKKTGIMNSLYFSYHKPKSILLNLGKLMIEFAINKS